MMKIYKNSLMGILAIASAIGFLVLSPSIAFAGNLVDVKFEKTPLFSETNITPGNSVVRWVEVENKSTQTLPIGVRATNNSVCSANCLADKLILEIKDGPNVLYGPYSLTKFFNDGEIKISDLAAGTTKKYDFSVIFLSDSGNDYQNSDVNFNLTIGAMGTESIGEETGSGGGTSAVIIDGASDSGGGGGGGSVLLPGLIIFNEQAIVEPEGTSAVITWNTNENSTSRVIYSSSAEPHTLQLDNLPNYGYAHSNTEDPAKVMNHSMTITSLIPGTTYYYRCISRGSFALSTEHSFTTSAEKTVIQKTGEVDENGVPVTEIILNFPKEAEPEGATEDQQNNNIENKGWNEVKGATGLMASLSNLFTSKNLCWIFFFFILVLTVLTVLSRKKKEEPKEKINMKKIIMLLILIVLLIAYYFLCPYCWLLIICVIIVFIFFIFFPVIKLLKK